ncbi:aminotransferase [Mycena floridula]|nr:aminotransferase [Mycena floridula]
MALWQSTGKGFLEGVSQLPDIDVGKLKIQLAETLKEVPKPEDLVFGLAKTDHMLVIEFDPATGWGAPEIRPYGPLSMDPASSCFQYATSTFEGMKAYVGDDGKPRLFRPQRNMERLARSAARIALPVRLTSQTGSPGSYLSRPHQPFDPNALLTLIKRLVDIDSRWIPSIHGYSLYLRPTMIGTRSALAVAPSDHATIYVIMSPTGPYFRSPKATSLLAVSETVRSWPGGTGHHKLGSNYAPGFLPQRVAAKQGYDQILWLIGDTITEAGAMNFFAVVQRDDGDLDIITPPLNGTILPGITRESCIELLNGHNSGTLTLPNIDPSKKLHVHETEVTMTALQSYSTQGKLLEVFGVGTAVIVAPVGKIGFQGKDLVFPEHQKAYGAVAQALWDRLVAIQEGATEWDGWSVPCTI